MSEKSLAARVLEMLNLDEMSPSGRYVGKKVHNRNKEIDAMNKNTGASKISKGSSKRDVIASTTNRTSQVSDLQKKTRSQIDRIERAANTRSKDWKADYVKAKTKGSVDEN